MAYIDTSVLVAFYCPEAISERVEAMLLNMEKPAISSLTEVEFASALSRKIREGSLSKEDGKKILLLFQAHITQKCYDVITLYGEHFKTAFTWLSTFDTPLRTLDALHLSVAMLQTRLLVTADMHLSRSANILGIKAELIEPV